MESVDSGCCFFEFALDGGFSHLDIQRKPVSNVVFGMYRFWVHFMGLK